MADIVISVAAKVAELLVDPIRRQICYVFKYHNNMEELKKQVKKLTDVKEAVQHSVVEATRQGDEIEKFVQKWLDDVDEFTKEVVKPIIDDEDKAKKLCSIGFCSNLRTRYSLSRKAVKTTKHGISLSEEAKFQKVSFRPPLRKTPSRYVRGYEEFDSRKPVFDDIMEALRDATVNLIGVYGIGGVGKTTLVKRVVGQVIEDRLFDVVVIVDVTQTPDIRKIQAQIGDELGLKFEEESLSGRAARLRDRLKKEMKVLLVLDDIWKKLDLEAVGIPLGDEEKRSLLQEDWEGEKGDQIRQCKLLMASRSEVVLSNDMDTKKKDQEVKKDNQIRQCKVLMTSGNEVVLSNDMDTKKNFLVSILSDEEAGDLFWKTVGDSAKNSDLDPIGVEIVKYCSGLPVAITTIATALKKRDLSNWKDALNQLRMADPRHIKGMDAIVYPAIKLSYDFLETEEAKSLFLICSLFNASSNIGLKYLLRYCMGFGLFQDVSTLEEARNRLHSLISSLKASCLLLDGDTKDDVKMHDIIHVVAVSIASTEKLMFNIQDVSDLKHMLEERLPRDSTAVSLRYKDFSTLPERLEYPKLKLLALRMKEFSLQLSATIFEGLQEIKVLDMTRIPMLSLPSSLSKLTNLQTLCMDRCQLGNVAIIGELKRLEILSFWGSDIEQLPEQIRQLTRLRLLNLGNCSKLKFISPNVLSSLTRLEEFYMGNSFIEWDVEGQSNASLFELKQLSHLTTLEIHVLDAQIIPKDLLILEKLERYRIFVGAGVWEWSDNHESSKLLKLKWNNYIYLENGVKSLLNGTDNLYLDGLEGVKNIVYQLNEEGFPQLKHLDIRNACEIQYIVKWIEWYPCNVFPMLENMHLHNLINLEKLCHGQLPTKSFNKLKIMKIGKCDRLKHLFSFSMAKNLLNLEEFEVIDCRMLEEIVLMESTEQFQQNDNIGCMEFAQLRTLRLKCLPRLTSFDFKEFKLDTGCQEIFAEDKLGGFMPSSSQNVLLPSLENLKLSSINIGCLWLDQLPTMSSCCRTLKCLILEECSGNLKFLFSYSMVKSLVLLEKLEIQNCKSIEGIINTKELRGEEKEIKMVFPKLIDLQLKVLPSLTQFCFGGLVEFPSLTQLSIEDCPKLKTFFSACLSSDIEEVKAVEEMNCENDIYPLFDEKVVLPSIASLNLSSINVQTIWYNRLETFSWFENLKDMILDGCDTLKYVFSSSMVDCLVKLEVLKVSNCKLMEGVIIDTEERTSNTFLPKLYLLTLKHLPELTSFSNLITKNSIELQSLAKLWIKNCPKMHVFVSDSPRVGMPSSKEEEMNSNHSHIQPLFDDKVSLPNLEDLRIREMKNMRKIWQHQLASNSFCKLDFFLLTDCPQLLNVFASNMLGRLKKLTFLVVLQCNSLEVMFEEVELSSCVLEEIVTEEENAEAISRVVFPQLVELYMGVLPKIRSFCSGFNISKWPKLKKLIIVGCNKVQILTPQLLSVQDTHGEIQHDNSIQDRMFIFEKLAFPNLEELALDWDGIVDEKLREQFSMNWCKLKELELVGTSKESVICACCFLSTLPNLERLGFSSGFIGEILICKGPDCKEKHLEALSKLNKLKLFDLMDSMFLWEENSLPCKVFQNLTAFEVSKCDKLKSLVPDCASFQNLETLEVSECNGLVKLLAPSTATSLVRLTKLKVTKCELIEEIICSLGGDKVEDRIIFNQLKYLELHCLPRLMSFYFGKYTIGFPSLQQVTVRQCPNMKIFSQGTLITPRMHNLRITEAEEEGLWEGSLNATIQKMFKDMVGFHDIETFVVSDFPQLKEVWHKQFLASRFINLKSLVVDDKCFSLRYIFTPSVALGLVRLQHLQIKNCAILEMIVSEEERIGNTLFPHLNRLDLKDLPELTSFCNFAENAIDLPSLESLWIYNCPKMETFISNSAGTGISTSKNNLQTNMQPLFDEKVRLSSLTCLRLYKMDKLRKIWHHQLLLDSFCKLKCLVVHDCHNVLIVFPSNMLGRLQKLDELRIKNCSLLDEVFEVQASSYGKAKAITATQLRKLFFKDLPKLQHIWDMNSQGLLTYQNLLSLRVIGCDSLESIFPASTGRNLLHLEQLLIVRCCMVEEIFAEEEEVDEAVPSFPQLTHLKLVDLPKLRSFYPRVHNSEWPMLKRLQVWNCDKVVISVSKYLSFQAIDGESQHEMSVEQTLPLLDKVPFTNLEALGLDWKWIEKEALHEKLPEYSVCKLKHLTFTGFHKAANICVYCFIHKLRNLETLQIVGGFFKEVFLSEGFACEEKHVEAPSKLSGLRLVRLVDSLHLWDINSLSRRVLQDLAILEVDGCGNLESLVPSSVSFQNLKTLEVTRCNKLLNLVGIPTAKSLVQLTKLSISECKMVEEIITHEGDDLEDRIIFRKLIHLELVCLPSLTSFYSGNYTTEFPVLQQVIVRECSNMKTFSQEAVSTPNLYGIQITEEAEGKGFWEGNLNTTIQHLFIENGQT